MKLTKKLICELNITNPHNYANGHPFISFTKADHGRGGSSAYWSICWPGHAFKGPWDHYGAIHFSLFGVTKEIALEEAKQKLMQLFGYKDLSITPFGSWMNREFVEQRNKQIESMIKEKKDGQKA
jgi:hypothetical protein